MNGTVLGVSQSFAYLEDMQNRIISFVERHSDIKAGRFRELMLNTADLTMDMGTVLDGESAVKEGLISRLGGLSDALEALYELIEQTPKRYQ
jgi:ATP-dependent protease ClpP protease subunit